MWPWSRTSTPLAVLHGGDEGEGAGLLEGERDRDLLAGGEAVLEVVDHDVVAARLEDEIAVGRDLEVLEVLHRRGVPLRHRFVEAGGVADVGGDAEERVFGAAVVDGEVDRGDIVDGRGGVLVRDGDGVGGGRVAVAAAAERGDAATGDDERADQAGGGDADPLIHDADFL